MKYLDFLSKQLWYSGHYELSIENNPYGDDRRINDAITELDKYRV